MAVALGVFASIVGLHASTLGLISFFANELPQPVPIYAVVRVGVGLNKKDGLSESDGEEPDVRLWNNFGDPLGTNIGDKELIVDGSYKDINVPENGQQPTYALLTANNNAICLAYVTQTWPDGQNYGWVGNWGRECGKEWYYSGVIIGDAYVLDCTWMDGAGGENPQEHTDVTGIQIHFTEFTDKGQVIQNDTKYYCSNPKTLGFRTETNPQAIDVYDPPLEIVPLDVNPNDRRRRSLEVASTSITDQYHHSIMNGTHHKSNSSSNTTPPKGRPTHRRRQDGPVDAELVRSKLPTHSATFLCEHPMSRGPDFVSHVEGKFCDMETRKVWPICGSVEEIECFDTETSGLKQLETRDVSAQAARKNYVKFRNWG